MIRTPDNCEWDELAVAGRASLRSEGLLLFGNAGAVQITALPKDDEFSEIAGAKLQFLTVKGSVNPWIPVPDRVKIYTPLVKFWAPSRTGKARTFFDEEGKPLVGVSVFYAMATNEVSERFRAVRLLKEVNPDLVKAHDGSVQKIVSDTDAFNECVKEWLFSRATDNRLSETAAESQIATNRIADLSRPRFRIWTRRNRHSVESQYRLHEKIFFRALNRAILRVEGVPCFNEVRSDYDRIASRLKIWEVKKKQAEKLKNDLLAKTVEELTAQGSARELFIRSFDRVSQEMGFGWLPKKLDMKALKENIRFYRLKPDI